MRVPRVFVPQTNPAQPQGGFLQGSSPQVRSTVGESLQDLAQTLRERKQKTENFDISSRLIEEANDLQQDFDQRKEAAPLGAANFTNEVDAAYTERHKAIVNEYARMGYSRDSLRELDLRLASYRQSYNGQAIAFQDQSYKTLVNKQTGDSVVRLSQYATQNPDAIESALTELQVLLRDAQGAGLDAIDAQQLYDQYESVILQGAGEGLALYHPQKVVNWLAPEEAVTSDVVTTSTSGDFNIDTYMQATRAAESTGDDAAKATTSSATGRYQFLKGTWLETYRKTYPESRETDAQILAKRKNGEVQDAVMKTFTLNNIRQLEGAQVPITNSSVYLAHFLGVPAAIAAFKSPAARNVSDFVSAEALAANKAAFGKVKTVEDLIAFADRKVGASNNPGAAASTTQVTSTRVVQPGVVRDSAAPPPAPYVPVVPGNIPIDVRQVVNNEDGTVSTVRTISIENDLGEVLIPTVIDGRVVSDSDAIAHYEETGEHLGVFKNAEEATAYAKWLHERHETDLAPTGNPVLDRMTGPQRLAVLQRARSELAKYQAENRAAVDVKIANEQAARLTDGEFAGEAATDAEIRAVYPPAIAEQKIREQQEIRRIGPFVKEMKMMTPQQIAEQLELLRPKDTASPTYATELQTFNLAQKAAQQNLELREKDPTAYTYGAFPNIAKALSSAESSSDRKAAYAALENAYNKLGVPAGQRTLFTKEMAAQTVERYKTMTPQQKVAMVEQWTAEMPSNLMANTLSQLSKSGIIDDVNLFAALVGHPNYRSLMTNVLAGQDIINADTARRPHPQVVNGVYRDKLGPALGSLNPEVSQMYKSSANALYVYMGGKPNSAEFDSDLYERALRMVVGGIDGREDTGIINMGGTKVSDNTILPPGITQGQFENWIDGLAVGDLTRLSLGKKPPATATGKGVPTQDIINFGVFVMVAPGRYVIKMNNTGGMLLDTSGSPFIVHVTPNTVRDRR